MKQENKFSLMEKTSNSTEKKILKFLAKNGSSAYGDVIKELKLSYSKGQNHLQKLIDKGYIRKTFKPLKVELDSSKKR